MTRFRFALVCLALLGLMVRTYPANPISESRRRYPEDT